MRIRKQQFKRNKDARFPKNADRWVQYVRENKPETDTTTWAAGKRQPESDTNAPDRSNINPTTKKTV